MPTVYSQFGEETHIWAILAEIGDGTNVCTDIGARLSGSNVARLILERGYKGNLIDANEDCFRELKETFPREKVQCVRATIENINQLVPRETWVLSIDVDSHDWWLWANLRARPAIVIMETTPCDGIQVAEYGAAQKDAAGYGASVEAMKMLGAMKRYDYIGRTEANAIFVRSDLKCQYRCGDVPGHGGRPSSRENNVFA
jgi:hypothetical protein